MKNGTLVAVTILAAYIGFEAYAIKKVSLHWQCNRVLLALLREYQKTTNRSWRLLIPSSRHNR